jgi:hemerythrin HHE cation binding domain-containing protein
MTALATDGRRMIRSFVDHEHRELAVGITHLHEVACELPMLSGADASTGVRSVLRWVDETLQPHMAWDDTWLFPSIEDRAQTHWATQLVRFDHRQISRRAERLRTHWSTSDGVQSGEAIDEIRCDLLALEALLRANLEREETLLLPLLEEEAEEWIPEWRD